MEFRPANRADRDAVEALLRQSYSTLLRDAYETSALEAALSVLSTAQDALLDAGTYLLVEKDRDLLAAGGWTPEAPGSGKITPGWAHIRHVAVAPDVKGQGVGRALIDRLADGAAAAGRPNLEALSTLNAVPFYLRLGFVRCEEVTVKLDGTIPFASVRMVRLATS